MTIPAIVTHGGVGSPVEQSDGTQRAAEVGLDVLHGGAAAPAAQSPVLTRAAAAAVEATAALEDDPRFNAGTGANLRLDGVSCELDASVATSEGRMGAVACIERVQHPVYVAARVLEIPHWLLVGAGATAFARRLGFADYDPITEAAREKWRRGRLALARRGGGERYQDDYQVVRWQELDVTRFWNFARSYEAADADLAAALAGPHDTVGAVARDAEGRFAAASSTGGTLLMLRGRVGDSPIVGAGLYAGPHGAVTATGLGEEIVRRLLSKTVYDRMAAGEAPADACRAAVADFPASLDVGVIAVNAETEGWAANRPMASGHARG
jgi:L-asparaginase/beta-aspartyl-peptidase (threonine type)